MLRRVWESEVGKWWIRGLNGGFCRVELENTSGIIENRGFFGVFRVFWDFFTLFSLFHAFSTQPYFQILPHSHIPQPHCMPTELTSLLKNTNPDILAGLISQLFQLDRGGQAGRTTSHNSDIRLIRVPLKLDFLPTLVLRPVNNGRMSGFDRAG